MVIVSASNKTVAAEIPRIEENAAQNGFHTYSKWRTADGGRGLICRGVAQEITVS